MWAFLTRLPLVATIITFVCVVIMFALGNWQLQRAEQKSQRLQSIENASKTAKIDLKQVMQAEIQEMLDMPVSFDGTADAQRYFLLDNKIHNGRVGYQVLVPLQTKTGTVLANFGWIAATNSREILPVIHISDVTTQYGGVIAVPLNNNMVQETAVIDGKWPKVIQQTDLKVVQQHLQSEVLPFVVLLDESDSSPLVRNWKAVVMAPEKHLAYAAQWFLLGLAAIVVFVIAQRKKLKRNKN